MYCSSVSSLIIGIYLAFGDASSSRHYTFLASDRRGASLLLRAKIVVSFFTHMRLKSNPQDQYQGNEISIRWIIELLSITSTLYGTHAAPVMSLACHQDSPAKQIRCERTPKSGSHAVHAKTTSRSQPATRILNLMDIPHSNPKSLPTPGASLASPLPSRSTVAT